MPNDIVSASTQLADDAAASADILRQLEGTDPSAVLLFMAPERDGASMVRTVSARFPSAEVVGCTTAGEFTERSYGVGGAVAMAIPRSKAPRTAAALGNFAGGVLDGVRGAAKISFQMLGQAAPRFVQRFRRFGAIEVPQV